jgi:hypothetical protein
MPASESQIAAILAADSGVAPEYHHAAKVVVSSDTLEPTGSILKWYALAPSDQPVPTEIATLARAYLFNTALAARGFGFVILHRCGRDFYFLIVSTWRGNNEIWESVYYKDGPRMAGFAPFPRDEIHKPTFCVWELAAVQHEQKAWTRFLLSSRDARAAGTWLADRYDGPA